MQVDLGEMRTPGVARLSKEIIAHRIALKELTENRTAPVFEPFRAACGTQHMVEIARLHTEIGLIVRNN
jgi:hypothetical protein